MARRIRIELARPGLADNGTPVPKGALDEIVETFSDIGDAPVTIGHPKGTGARFGDVVAVGLTEDRGGPVYFADLDLHDALADAYVAGHYTRWSLGAKARPSDGKRYLHHLAFLGDTPPALKGLRVLKDLATVELADGEELQTITLSDPTAVSKPDDQKTPADPKADPKTPVAQDVTLSDEYTKLHAQVERLRASERSAKLGRLRDAVKGRLPKPAQDALVELADQAAQQTAEGAIIELSDGDATVKVDLLDALVRVVEMVPSPVRPGALDLGDIPEEDRAGVDASKVLNAV